MNKLIWVAIVVLGIAAVGAGLYYNKGSLLGDQAEAGPYLCLDHFKLQTQLPVSEYSFEQGDAGLTFVVNASGTKGFLMYPLIPGMKIIEEQPDAEPISSTGKGWTLYRLNQAVGAGEGMTAYGLQAPQPFYVMTSPDYVSEQEMIEIVGGMRTVSSCQEGTVNRQGL